MSSVLKMKAGPSYPNSQTVGPSYPKPKIREHHGVDAKSMDISKTCLPLLVPNNIFAFHSQIQIKP